MKILRSVTRRGFNIGTAGWFTVLKPNTWFPATRLHDRFRYPGSRPTPVGDPLASENPALGPENVIAPRIITLNGHDRRLLRRGLIVLAAMVITSLLLLWIIRPY